MNITQEDKQLLFKDLCARLPYGVILDVDNGKYREDKKIWPGLFNSDSLWDAKPYLRPMSSITEEEENEFNHVFELELAALEELAVGHTIKSAASNAFVIDFYNRHHFDYRGLIPMGLALEAREEMYKND